MARKPNLNLTPTEDWEDICVRFNDLIMSTSVIGNYEQLDYRFRTMRREFREMITLLDLVNKLVADGKIDKDNYISNWINDTQLFDEFLLKLSLVWYLNKPTQFDVRQIMRAIVAGKLNGRLKSVVDESCAKVCCGVNLYKAFNVPSNYGFHIGDPSKLQQKDYDRLRRLLNYMLDDGMNIVQARKQIMNEELNAYFNTVLTPTCSETIVDVKVIKNQWDYYSWYVLNDWLYSKLVTYKGNRKLTKHQVDIIEKEFGVKNMVNKLEVTSSPKTHPINWKKAQITATVIRSSM